MLENNVSKNIVWINGEEKTEKDGNMATASTRQLVEMFDYFMYSDPRRTDDGELGDRYSEDMAEVQDEIERRYFASYGLPEYVVHEILSSGINWPDDGYVGMAEVLRKNM